MGNLDMKTPATDPMVQRRSRGDCPRRICHRDVLSFRSNVMHGRVDQGLRIECRTQMLEIAGFPPIHPVGSAQSAPTFDQ